MGLLGGEEFAISLSQTPIEEAMHVAERLRAVVAEQTYQYEEHTLQVTISLGVAEMDVSTEDLKMVIQRADKAVYDAKDLGRNQVVQAKGLRPE